MAARRYKPHRSRPSDPYRVARGDEAQLTLAMFTTKGCRAWYVVDRERVIGRSDLCSDCRLVELAVRVRVSLRR